MQVDVKNAFNNISWITISRKLQNGKGPLVSIVPFTTLFYGVHFFLYYQDRQHEERVTVIEYFLSMK
jgi:hypothetical protein